MTEDQKTISLILDLLQASKGVPRTLVWIISEVRLAGRAADVPAIMDLMLDAKLAARQKDGLGIYRYTITPAGKEALANL